MIESFLDELDKIAAAKWFTNLADAVMGPPVEHQSRMVDYFFSTRAGPDKWDKFLKNIRSRGFLDQIRSHPLADDKLRLHAESMHDLSRGQTIQKMRSMTKPGLSYEVRKIAPGTFGCTCPDWRYVGSVRPGYECKHIRAFKSGLSKVGSALRLLPFITRVAVTEKAKDLEAQKRRRRAIW
jgi:hypothetical protein